MYIFYVSCCVSVFLVYYRDIGTYNIRIYSSSIYESEWVVGWLKENIIYFRILYIRIRIWVWAERGELEWVIQSFKRAFITQTNTIVRFLCLWKAVYFICHILRENFLIEMENWCGKTFRNILCLYIYTENIFIEMVKSLGVLVCLVVLYYYYSSTISQQRNRLVDVIDQVSE